jgi:glycosyltransferase involved in cell wall biosynthesis
MSYAPNVTAAEFLARRILPRVGEAFSSVRLVLVGRGPSSSIRALGALPGVEVVGEVPDMRPWLSRAGVYVCPMLTGTGMKNKLLEAMANGLACVATPLAVQGLAVTHGQDILMGSTEEELARHVIRLIQEPVLADRIGVAGRAYVRSRHTWTSMAARYEQIYRQLASGPELP